MSRVCPRGFNCFFFRSLTREAGELSVPGRRAPPSRFHCTRRARHPSNLARRIRGPLGPSWRPRTRRRVVTRQACKIGSPCSENFAKCPEDPLSRAFAPPSESLDAPARKNHNGDEAKCKIMNYTRQNEKKKNFDDSRREHAGYLAELLRVREVGPTGRIARG